MTMIEKEQTPMKPQKAEELLKVCPKAKRQRRAQEQKQQKEGKERGKEERRHMENREEE